MVVAGKSAPREEMAVLVVFVVLAILGVAA
jgi:hypothetical protein